jgi:DNA-binding PadR family transcriptional regulator
MSTREVKSTKVGRYELTDLGRYEMALCEHIKEIELHRRLKAELEISVELWRDSVIAAMAEEHYNDCQEIMCELRLCELRRNHWREIIHSTAYIPF